MPQWEYDWHSLNRFDPKQIIGGDKCSKSCLPPQLLLIRENSKIPHIAIAFLVVKLLQQLFCCWNYCNKFFFIFAISFLIFVHLGCSWTTYWPMTGNLFDVWSWFSICSHCGLCLFSMWALWILWCQENKENCSKTAHVLKGKRMIRCTFKLESKIASSQSFFVVQSHF